MTDMRRILILAAACAVASCGGGGEPVAGVDRGGVRVAIVTKGEITGFGSVIVNGVHYDTGGAVITIDGEPGTEQDLSVGAVVTINGVVDKAKADGTAERIVFDDNVEGRISALDNAAGTAVVLGQTVKITLDTFFEGEIAAPEIGALSTGDAVEVSGFEQADGSIEATLVRVKTAPDRLEVTGVVAQLDTAALTFRIGALVVDYSAAMLEDFPAGEPANGDRVEVKGSQQGAAGELIAESVELKSGPISPADEDDEAEIEGLITRFVDATDFDVAGQPVTTDGDTRYENGDSGALAEDIRVEVEGVVTGAGTILAREIEFEISSQARLEGPVDAVDGAAGSLTVIGVVVATDGRTRFQDRSDQRLRPFSLSDIASGDRVLVAGTEASGSLTAKSVTREDPDGAVSLRATATDLADPEFSLLGVTVRTGAATTFEQDDQGITAAEFFRRAAGRTVEARGTMNGDVLLAERVEITD